MRAKSFLFLGLLAGILIATTSLFFFKVTERRTVDFRRKTRSLHTIAALDLKVNSYYFAGKTSEQLYVANATQPLVIRVFNKDMTERAPLQISSNLETPIAWRATLITVNYPSIFYEEVVTPNYLIADFRNTEIHRYFSIPYKIEIGLPLDSNNFLVRCFDFATKKTKLRRLSRDPVRQVDFENAFEFESELPFSKEGMLNYDASTGFVVYTSYYNNTFTIFDTAGRISYTGNTIDTCCDLKALSTSTNASTEFLPLLINRQAVTDQGKLYIISTAQTKDSDEENIPLDVYSLRTGTYLFSIYLPKQGGDRLRSFEVVGNRIFCIFESQLIVFQW